MTLIDFTAEPKRAFFNGFLKGLGAPFVLFGSFTAPGIIDIPLIQASSVSNFEAMAGDWERIGIDMHRAVALNGKTSSAE